jgi:hypothetical protein
MSLLYIYFGFLITFILRIWSFSITRYVHISHMRRLAKGARQCLLGTAATRCQDRVVFKYLFMNNIPPLPSLFFIPNPRRCLAVSHLHLLKSCHRRCSWERFSYATLLGLRKANVPAYSSRDLPSRIIKNCRLGAVELGLSEFRLGMRSALELQIYSEHGSQLITSVCQNLPIQLRLK